jgi:hypothetical protein
MAGFGVTIEEVQIEGGFPDISSIKNFLHRDGVVVLFEYEGNQCIVQSFSRPANSTICSSHP